MSDHALKRLIVLVATALAVVIAGGAVAGSRSAARDLTDRSDRALAAAGLDGVRVDFAGREAELSGGNDLEARMAGTLVRTLPGVRSVTLDRDDDAPVTGVPHVQLDRAGDEIQIGGAVSSPDDAAAIKVAAATALRATISGDVAVRPSVGSAGWVADLPDVFEIVAGVRGLELDVRGDGTVELGGQVASEQDRTSLARRVAAALPDLELVDTLRVGVGPAGTGGRR